MYKAENIYVGDPPVMPRGKSFSDRPSRVRLLGFISLVGLEFNFGFIL